MTQSVSHNAIQLSLSATYYLRKLLHQNLHNLKSIVAMGAAIQADEVSDINAVLGSLYFEDEELAAAISQIDRAVATHEAMASQPGQFQKERSALEEKIFWLLGYKFRSSERSMAVSKGSVLVVEGDRVCADALMMDLQGQQYSVTIASNAQQAWAQLDLDLPDALVVSMKLPGLSGDEFCRRMKASNYGVIPIILVGTKDSLAEEARAFEAGAIDYLVRPFQVQELTLRLQARRQLQEFQKRLAENNQQLQLEVEKTRRLEERSRSIFEDAVVGMFQSTSDGRYLQANYAMAALYGYASPQELMGRVNHIGQQVYVDAQRRREFVAYMQCFKSVVAFESQVYRQDGSMIWISESVRSVFDASGEFLFYEGTVQDITDRKVLEQRFQVQYRVTEQLAQAATLLQGSQVLLREVGGLLGWERGEVWLLRSPMEVLQKVDRWYADGPQTPQNPPKLNKNEGLPGFIWSHGQTIWIADLQQVPQLTAEERVRYWGFKSVIGVPCYHGEALGASKAERFVGVVLWLSKEMVELEESGLLSTIQVMGHQFAQFVGRRYAESNLRQSEKRLRSQALELQGALSELKETQQTLMTREQQALLGQLATDLMRELVEPMDFVDRNLAHTEDYVHDLVALLKLYREKTAAIPKLQAEIAAADAIDLDFLVQEFPKLTSAVHEGVQLIHRKVESLTQAVAIEEI